MKSQAAVVVRLKILMKLKGINPNALANNAGVPISTLRNILNGNSHGTQIPTINALCDGLGISLRDFFNDPIFGDLDQEIERKNETFLLLKTVRKVKS